VQSALEKRRLGLKIYDAYRPVSVQKIFWELLPDTRFVADPKVGSKHNRGTAVDVTLVDQLGRDLPMPTPYDEFSERAHATYRGCAPEEGENRDLLKQAMVKEGFVPYIHEWWHFDDPDWERYPLLDLPFEGGHR
jgi:D-alanyl-D-alanine dipeptidase